MPRLNRHALIGAAALPVMLTPTIGWAGFDGTALGQAILYWLEINAALYLFILLCAVAAAVLWRRYRRVAVILLIAGCTPLAHYGFEYARTLLEPQRRADEVAALPRQPLPPRSSHVLEVIGGPGAAEVLVATGIVPEAFITTLRGETYAYIRHEGWECLRGNSSGDVQTEIRRVALARLAFRVCAKTEQREHPPQASLQLFKGSNAPHWYRGPACMDWPDSAVELRWAPRHGGMLVAVLEPPIRTGYRVPPLLMPDLPSRLWLCPDRPFDPEGDDEAWRRLDDFRFVAEALGYASIDDLPRTPDADAVAQALQRLQTPFASGFAYRHILALMGQWPATPATDALIGAGPIAREAKHMLLGEAAGLLGDPRHAQRQRQLYPQLASHVPALLRACALHPGGADAEQACRVLARVSEEGKK